MCVCVCSFVCLFVCARSLMFLYVCVVLCRGSPLAYWILYEYHTQCYTLFWINTFGKSMKPLSHTWSAIKTNKQKTPELNTHTHTHTHTTEM